MTVRQTPVHRAAVTGKVVASLLLLLFVAATALLLGFGFRPPKCASDLERSAAELGLYARQMATAERTQLSAASSEDAGSGPGVSGQPGAVSVGDRTSLLVGRVALGASSISRCVGRAMSYSGWMCFGAGVAAALALSSTVALIRWTTESHATRVKK